jgi:hypothetical protein
MHSVGLLNPMGSKVMEEHVTSVFRTGVNTEVNVPLKYG